MGGEGVYSSMRSAALAITAGDDVRVLNLAGSEDIKCSNLMCERIGGPCVCRLARYIEQHAGVLQHTVRELDLSDNALPAFPESVLKLQSLRTLRLRANALEIIPLEALVSNLPHLEMLDVRENPGLILDADEARSAVNSKQHQLQLLWGEI